MTGKVTPPSEPRGPFATIKVAAIGVGGHGGTDVDLLAAEGANIVALCDVDATYAAKKFAQYPNARKFSDYRVMLDTIGDEIDAVLIGTPDHTHAVIAMECMKRGKHIYCEKPLARTVGDTRALIEAAEKYGVVTQLGNQGHASPNIRRICEWIWAGAIGQVHTIYAGCGEFKNVYDQRSHLAELDKHHEVPPDLDYELWVGPVEFQPYNPLWVPWNWRGWMSFGTGTIGDWICHVVDPSFWALDLGAPSSVTAEVSDWDPAIQGLTYPPATRITFEFPENEQRGPVKLIWQDGDNKIPAPTGFPADVDVPRTGAILIGDRGMIVHGSHGGGGCKLLPEAVSARYTGANAPAETIDRVKNHQWDWLEAIRTGRQSGSNFAYGGRLTQIALLGTIAIYFPGETLHWDDTAMRFTNNEAANASVAPEYRQGWHL